MKFSFLMCSERSGSNLITKLLDAHPAVCGPFPSHLIRSCAPHLFRYGDLSKDSNWNTLINDIVHYMNNKTSVWRTAVTEEDIRSGCASRTFADIVRLIYEQEAAAHEKSEVFIKENHIHLFFPFLITSFPKARYVWMVRDPRDMALTWKEAGSALGGVRRAVGAWLDDQREYQKLYGYLGEQGTMLLIRFEDLLSQTVQTLKEVCVFLEIPYTTEMLDFYKKDITKENANRLSSWKDLGQPIMPENIGRYKNQLSEIEIRYIEACCFEEMDFFGYDRDVETDAETGSIERIEQRLPPEPETRDHTEQEKRIYPAFLEAKRIFSERKLYG